MSDLWCVTGYGDKTAKKTKLTYAQTEMWRHRFNVQGYQIVTVTREERAYGK